MMMKMKTNSDWLEVNVNNKAEAELILEKCTNIWRAEAIFEYEQISFLSSYYITENDFPAELKYSQSKNTVCFAECGLEYANSFESAYDFINYLDNKKLL